MEKNEIKKLLYKEKPSAIIIHVTKSGILYSCQLLLERAGVGGSLTNKYENFYFHVPIAEIGDAPFLKEMPAQLLIRYLIEEPEY